MIEVQDLVKRYGSYLAVDHLSFSAEKGQIYGFLGPNGAGKSTTMNIMTGCLAPTSGTVLVDGMDLQQQPDVGDVRHVFNVALAVDQQRGGQNGHGGIFGAGDGQISIQGLAALNDIFHQE